MATRRIGFYGGTFDPIHLGHLNLALSLKEAQQLDEVWLCPAWVSPYKQDEKAASPHHRLAMVRLAVEEVPDFSVIDDEVIRGGTSYTVDTLRFLKEKNPDADFFLLLGDETANHFSGWKEPEEILKLATPLIGTRSGEGPSELGVAIPTPIFEITATDIRKRLSEGKYCGHLLPQKVIDYIGENALY